MRQVFSPEELLGDPSSCHKNAIPDTVQRKQRSREDIVTLPTQLLSVNMYLPPLTRLLLYYLALFFCYRFNGGLATEDIVVAGLIPVSTEPTGQLEKEAFLHAVEDINANNSILSQHRIVARVYDTKGDTWMGFESAVEAITAGAIAFVGPGLSTVARVVSPLATHTSIPFVTPTAPAEALAFHEVHKFVLQLSPSDRLLSQAVVDILLHFGWKHIGVVRSSDEYGRNRLRNINTVASENGIQVVYTVRIPSSPAGDTVAEQMKQLNYLLVRIFVVDVLDHELNVVFHAAAKEGMIGDDYLWILSSDAPTHTLNTNLVKLMEGSIGLSTAPPQGAKQWQTEHNVSSTVSIYQLYTYDSVWLLARALDNFLSDGHTLQTQQLSVQQTGMPLLHTLSEGHTLVDYIRNVSFEGASGYIKFNVTGERVKVLNIVNMVNGSFETVGQWIPNGQTFTNNVHVGGTYPEIIWPSGSTTKPTDRASSLTQTVHTMVLITEPYIFYNPMGKDNARFSGYLIDILKQLQERIGFTYHLEIWNGTYNELVRFIARADNPYTLGVADVIITSDRWKVVDFTTSFHLTTMTMLLKAPEIASASGIWGFLAPFHYSVWLVLLAFFFFSAVVLKTTEAFRVYHPSLKIGECIWMSFSVFFGTHKDDAVTSVYGRGWLIITLMTLTVINAAYTAVLTTFLLSKELHVTVPEVQDLLKEPIGTLSGSHYVHYLKNIEGLHHVKEMSIGQAPEEVLAGNIQAFISSRLTLQYITSQNCSVYIPSSDHDFRKENIAFVVQKGSVLTAEMNRHIQDMWDSNYLSLLYKRHFVWSSQCDQLNTPSEVDTVDLGDVAGVFLILAVVTVLTITGQFAAKRWFPNIGNWCQGEDPDEFYKKLQQEYEEKNTGRSAEYILQVMEKPPEPTATLTPIGDNTSTLTPYSISD